MAALLASWPIPPLAVAQTGQTEGQSHSPREGQQAPAEQTTPVQQYSIQLPTSPFVTPLTAPATTLPPWVPPAAPAPSQTNLPVPFPVPVPGAPGPPGGPAVPDRGIFALPTATARGATLELRPTAKVAEEYSDNFFQTTDQPQRNFRTIWGPGFTLLLNGARTSGSASVNLDMVHDTAQDSGNTVKFFPSLNAILRYAFTPRLTFSLTESFVRNDQPSTVDQFGIRSGRQIFDTNTLGVAAEWLIDQFTTQAYYRNVLFFNESGNGETVPSGNTNNNITNIFGVNASARFAIDYGARIGYEFSHTRDLGTNAASGGDSNSNTTNTGFVAVSRQFGVFASAGLSSSYSYQTDESTSTFNASVFGTYGLPNSLSISGSVGYSVINSDTQDNDGTMSLNFNAIYRPTPKLSVSVGMFRDFQQTAQQGQDFGTVQTQAYHGSLTYQATPFINTALNVTYRENQGTGTGNTQSNDKETNLTCGASLNWQLLRWLVGTLGYTYTKQTGQGVFNQQTGIGGNGYTENRVSLSFFASF